MKYQIKYTLTINNRVLYFVSKPLKAICKLHALLRFKMIYKHNKCFKREILKVSRVKKHE